MTIESLAKSLQSHRARHLANGGKVNRIIYPVALRKRAANFIHNEGLSDFDEVGLRLGVAPKTIGKWLLKFSLNASSGKLHQGKFLKISPLPDPPQRIQNKATIRIRETIIEIDNLKMEDLSKFFDNWRSQ